MAKAEKEITMSINQISSPPTNRSKRRAGARSACRAAEGAEPIEVHAYVVETVHRLGGVV